MTPYNLQVIYRYPRAVQSGCYSSFHAQSCTCNVGNVSNKSAQTDWSAGASSATRDSWLGTTLIGPGLHSSAARARRASGRSFCLCLDSSVSTCPEEGRLLGNICVHIYHNMHMHKTYMHTCACTCCTCLYARRSACTCTCHARAHGRLDQGADRTIPAPPPLHP